MLELRDVDPDPECDTSKDILSQRTIDSVMLSTLFSQFLLLHLNREYVPRNPHRMSQPCSFALHSRPHQRIRDKHPDYVDLHIIHICHRDLSPSWRLSCCGYVRYHAGMIDRSSVAGRVHARGRGRVVPARLLGRFWIR